MSQFGCSILSASPTLFVLHGESTTKGETMAPNREGGWLCEHNWIFYTAILSVLEASPKSADIYRLSARVVICLISSPNGQ